jgi:regulator of RNase E activity RraA
MNRQVLSSLLFAATLCAGFSSPDNPANVAGEWLISLKFVAGTAQHIATIIQNGDKISGEYKGEFKEGTLSGVVQNNRVDFTARLSHEATTVVYHYTGKSEGDRMTGEVDMGEYWTAEWTAVRNQSFVPGGAQAEAYSNRQLLKYSSLYKGERFPDGRPKVPDLTIERLKSVSLEAAWSVLRNAGYHNQFESNWVTNPADPLLVGRAVTAAFMPIRPDMNDIILAKGKSEGRIGAQNSWVIDTLVKGDVLVVDLFGKVINGTFAGDNLGNSIHSKTGNGMIIDGGCRDLMGIAEIKDFPVFVRGWDPSFLSDVMLTDINGPIRIGRATVLPGDAILANREGILFIPAHLAEEVVEVSELIGLRDEFGQQRLREGKYTPGQIDSQWTAEIEKDFDNWLKKKGKNLTPYQQEKLRRGRTW